LKGCATEEAAVRPDWDVVWLSDIPWSGLWQRPQQLATRFPEGARILFVEPWTLGHRGALRPEQVAPRVRRVSLPFLPLHARSLRIRRAAYALGSAAPVTAALFGLQAAWASGIAPRRAGGKRLALVQNFMAAPFLAALRPDRIVYDMIDAPLHFAPVPPQLVPRWERLLRTADRVVVTSRGLQSLALSVGAPAATIVGNGVEAARFDPDRVMPAELPGDRSRPVLGYVGSLHSWFDVPLVTALARSLPDARVVLVGPAHPETARSLERAMGEAPNLAWLGPKPYDEVPAIVRAFRVGLIPFRRTPLTEAVNPVKLYEYAAAGVPCVATRFTDEVEAWSPAARVAGTEAEFIAFAKALLSDRPDPAALVAFGHRHDWDAIARRFAAICLEEEA
jgi:glycosyltransferase involved in cell wall biosynthesis